MGLTLNLTRCTSARLSGAHIMIVIPPLLLPLLCICAVMACMFLLVVVYAFPDMSQASSSCLGKVFCAGPRQVDIRVQQPLRDCFPMCPMSTGSRIFPS
jgi:hypothetical protein